MKGFSLDRGSRAISFVLSALVFNVVPTFLELSIVSGVLAFTCGPAYAAVAVSTVALYSVFTFAFTEWRTKFRVAMNLFLFTCEVFVFVDAEIQVDAFACSH